MSPDPILTRELDSLFDAEPPLRATPEQVLNAARAARRHRQRIAVAGSAIGTVVLVGATAATAAGLSGGPTPNRTADGTGGLTPTASCTVRTVVPPTPLPSVVPPRMSPTVVSTPTRAPLPADRPYPSPSAQPTGSPAPPAALTPVAPPAASPTVPYLTVAPSGRVSGAERMPTVMPDETPVPLPSAEVSPAAVPPGTPLPLPSVEPSPTAVPPRTPLPSAELSPPGAPATPPCAAVPSPR